MDSRNRIDVAETYTHIYNRGAFKQPIFKSSKDYAAFLQLLKRYLGEHSSQNTQRHGYANFSQSVELLAYCLMPNHYHLLLYQKEDNVLSPLMRRVGAGYAQYFLKQYQHSGAVFQGRYKTKTISNEAYLWHISRYIHLNPHDSEQGYADYSYSSYHNYLGRKKADWLKPQRILALHGGKDEYKKFVADYAGYRKELKDIKSFLVA